MEWSSLDDPAFWLATGSVVMILGGAWLWSWLWKHPYDEDLMSTQWRKHPDRYKKH